MTIAHDDPVRMAFKACAGSYKTRGEAVRAFDSVLMDHGLCLDWYNAYDFTIFLGRRVFPVQTGQGERAGIATFSWVRAFGKYVVDGYLA